MKTEPLKTAMTKIFDLNLPYFHRVTKNHRRFLQSPVPLFLQVGNIRSRINPPDAFLLASKRLRAGGQSPPADKDRQTGLMKNFREQSGKVIRDRA
jgi:hypothetical protein